MENLEGANNKYDCKLRNLENNLERLLPIIKQLL